MKSKDIESMIGAISEQMETCIPQTENNKRDTIVEDCKLHLQELSEMIDESRDLPRLQLLLFRSAILRLLRIFEEQRDGVKGFVDEKSISSAAFEKELAECISGCLPDVPLRKKNISRIQSLVAGGKLVQSLPDETLSVSPFRAHMLFQDNYAGSCLCRLFNLLFADLDNSFSKSITY